MITKPDIFNFLINQPEALESISFATAALRIGVLMIIIGIIGIIIAYVVRRKNKPSGAFKSLLAHPPAILILAIVGILPAVLGYNSMGYYTQAYKQHAELIYTTITNPEARILAADIGTDNRVTAYIGWKAETRTQAIKVLGQETTAKVEIRSALSISLKPDLVEFLTKNNVQIAGKSLGDSITDKLAVK